MLKWPSLLLLLCVSASGARLFGGLLANKGRKVRGGAPRKVAAAKAAAAAAANTAQVTDSAAPWRAWRADHCQVKIYTVYADLREVFKKDGEQGLAQHYSQWGRGEGRNCNTTVINVWQQDHCTVEYYTQDQDLNQLFKSEGEDGLMLHYVKYGRGEGRNCNTSCIDKYKYEVPPRIPSHTGPSIGRLNVLVPMRGREEHLQKFIPAFLSSMEHNGIEARIFVVEQKDAGHWNKGRLFNIGFQQATAHKLAFGEASWLFSDVDVFETVPGRLAYKDCISASDGSIHHLYGIGGGNSGNKTYGEGVLGGMFCLPSRLYTNVNGFSNRFWGWGFEDSDFEHRMRAAGVAVNRSALIPRLGARGDCLSEIGLADLPTPRRQIKVCVVCVVWWYVLCGTNGVG
jgi:hypothetical protein